MPAPLYAPSFSEKQRQDFVLGIKLLANQKLQANVRSAFDTRVASSIEPSAAKSTARELVRRPLARTSEFRLWASVTHASQSMMWRAVEATVTRSTSPASARLQELLGQTSRTGTLELQPGMAVPAPISRIEIHRQPGGYVAETHAFDLAAGLRYFGSGQIYSPGKGNTVGADSRGAYIAELIRARYPGFAPRRLLDMGCGIGLATQGLARAFPRAECTAIDVAAPLLRFAHLTAAEQGVHVHFKQRDAANTGFAAGSFDLIVSNIMFHETSAEHLPAIVRECHRLLAPGGAMFHLDVPTQTARLAPADQVMNDWQVVWNGEPFWTGFSDTDMRAELLAAGFPDGSVFAEHVARPGGGYWYVFGARA
jgi:SAM-dependent methyltransferase